MLNGKTSSHWLNWKWMNVIQSAWAMIAHNVKGQNMHATHNKLWTHVHNIGTDDKRIIIKGHLSAMCLYP